jgi:hypothetical protein
VINAFSFAFKTGCDNEVSTTGHGTELSAMSKGTDLGATNLGAEIPFKTYSFPV